MALPSPGRPVCHLLFLLGLTVRPRMNHPVPLSLCKRTDCIWQRRLREMTGVTFWPRAWHQHLGTFPGPPVEGGGLSCF